MYVWSYWGSGCSSSNRFKLMKRSIVARNLTSGKMLFFESAAEASREHGFDESHIVKCCRGRRNKHAGYKWSYYLPVKTLEESVEDSWTLRENEIILKNFSSGDLGDLLKRLPGRDFKDLIWRAKILGVTRNTATSKYISPYDLINELAEDILFSEV